MLSSPLLVVLAVAATAAAVPIPVQVCVPINGFFYQTIFVPQYYTYQNIQPNVKIVGYVEYPTTTARGVTLALARNGSDCYAYIGPHTSPMVIAANSVINSLWVAYSAAAMEFSDRVNYPLLNRVSPRVDSVQPAIVALMRYFKWTDINILCTDNAYGQAAASAVSSLLAAAGGHATATCVGQFASYDAVAAVVAAALKSPSRVLFIAAIPGEAAHVSGVPAIHALDPTHSLIVAFTEPFCVGNEPLWKTISGAFCASYVANSAYDDFYRAYLKRDTTDERRIVGAIPGLAYSKAAADNTYGSYNVLAADATRVIYAALDKYVGIYGTLPPTPAIAAAWTRNQTLDDGFMGPIAIPNGDRVLPTSMRVVNAGTNNVTTFVANFTPQGNFTMTATSVYVLGQQMLLADVPPAVDPPLPSAGAQPYWIIGVVAPCVLLLLVAAVRYMRHRCYEARRVDESTVMVVAKQVDNVLRCAATVMASMDGADWSAVMCHANEMVTLVQKREGRSVGRSSIGTSKSRVSHRHGRSTVLNRDKCTRGSSLVSLGSQPRLHIGVHYGYGMIDHDESLNTVSYVGAAVTRAAEVADVAVKGQVLVSREDVRVAALLYNNSTLVVVDLAERLPPYRSALLLLRSIACQRML